VSGFLVQQGATVLCSHGGQAQATAPNPRVTVGGAATVVITGQWTVGGCPGVPAAGVPPCTTSEWVTGTGRVTSGRQPLVIVSGDAVSAPGGVPLLPLDTQLRVTAE
jgi:hypothetical protein